MHAEPDPESVTSYHYRDTMLRAGYVAVTDVVSAIGNHDATSKQRRCLRRHILCDL